MIPRLFAGQPCFIVGGGPSLRGFHFARLRGLNVIAINRAYEFLPDADVLWWSDADFWRQHRLRIDAHGARVKATLDRLYDADEPPAPVHKLKVTGISGLDDQEGCIRHGNSSVYAAMHFAAQALGASMEVLLGVDMRYGSDGASHFHGGHSAGGTPLHHQEDSFDYMLPHFASLAGPLKERGVEVLNASHDSRLTVWPRRTIDEAIDEVISKHPVRVRNP